MSNVATSASAFDDFLNANAAPADKSDTNRVILSRKRLQRLVAPVILRGFRDGREPSLDSLYEFCLAGVYPTRAGAMKSLGDGLGQNHGGLRLHRTKNGIKRCKQNVALILKASEEREAVAMEAGFVSVDELVEFAATLPTA